MKTPRRITTLIAGYWLLITLLAMTAQAGTHTWNGGSTDGRWSVGANWDGGNPPFANESPLHLIFPSSATRRLSTNNIANITISSMTFDGVAYTIAASGQGTNVTVDSSVGQSYWNIRALSGTGHTLHYSMNLALDGNLEFNIATNASVTVRSRLSAATANSGLSKDGPGAVILQGIEDNTFDGFTTVLNGLLELRASHLSFGFTVNDTSVPGPLIIGGNSLAQQPVVLVWLADQIADSSAVTINRNGEMLFADVDDTIGSLTMAGGYLDTENGTLTLNGNVLFQNPPSGTPSQLRGYIDLGPVGRFFTVETNAYVDMGAIISGGKFGNVPAGVNKLGPGWMAFTGPSNTFGGELYISGGTVSITSGKQIGATTNAASVASGGTLALSGIGSGPIVNAKKLNLQTDGRLQALLDSQWNGPVQLYGKAIVDVRTNIVLELGGIVSGVGGFTKTGPGELLLTGLDSNTFTGPACVDDGLLSLDKVGLFTNAIAISGPLVIGGADETKSPRAVLFADQEIAATVPVIVNLNGELDLGSHQQSVHTLAINGGHADSGALGAFHLIDTLTSTNDLTHYGRLDGWLDLGNSPRTIFAPSGNGWLDIYARITGGPAGTLNKTGPGRITLLGANIYDGLTQIQEGWIEITHPTALGSTVNGTVVNDFGALYLDSHPWGHASMTITNEALSLAGYGGVPDNTYNGCFASFGTNVWQGVITLTSSVSIRSETATDRLILNVRVQGPYSLHKTGKGSLVYTGTGSSSFNNTYTGTTYVEDGDLLLAKQDAIFANTSLASNLVLTPYQPGSTPIVRVQGRNQFSGANAVTVNTPGQLRFESPSLNSIGSLTGDGVVDFLPGSRVVTGVNGQSTTFAGTLQGGGINDTNLSMQGSGIFTLAGANTLAGRVEVSGGTLRVNSAQPAARVDVKAQGTLGGTGSINLITMRGGYLAPGAPIGKLHAASCAVGGSHYMNFDLNGPALGTGYDQFEVDVAPNLSSTILGTAFGNGYNPTNGQQFLILRNNSGLPVAAPFLSASEGSEFYVDNFHRVKITYLGGDGNDVVLTVIAGVPQLKGITVNGNRAYIDGCGTPGSLYQVQATTNIVDAASWVNLGNITASAAGTMQYIDTDMALYPHRFFRFVAP